MRFNRYLNEAIKPQLIKAVRITQKAQLEFFKQLDEQWKKYKRLTMNSLTRMLSIAFLNFDIEVEQASKATEKDAEYSRNEFVVGGLHDLNGTIILELTKKTAEKLNKAIRNAGGDVMAIVNDTIFFDEIVNILSHELVHREAYKRAGVKMLNREDPSGKFNVKRYFSDTQEIVAFGQQYANDVYSRRDSDIKEMYLDIFGKTHKVYKKFMRVYQETLDALKRGDIDRSLD